MPGPVESLADPVAQLHVAVISEAFTAGGADSTIAEQLVLAIL
jgi:hypothetical protein